MDPVGRNDGREEGGLDAKVDGCIELRLGVPVGLAVTVGLAVPRQLVQQLHVTFDWQSATKVVKPI